MLLLPRFVPEDQEKCHQVMEEELPVFVARIARVLVMIVRCQFLFAEGY